MNEIIGIVLLSTIFIGIFVVFAKTSSWKIALITFFSAIVIFAIVIVGAYMATGNLKIF